MANDFEAPPRLNALFGPAWEEERQKRIRAWKDEQARAVTSNGVVGRVITRQERRARDKQLHDERNAEFERRLPELQAENDKLMQTPFAKTVRAVMPDSLYVSASAGPIGFGYNTKDGWSSTVRPDELNDLKRVFDRKAWRARVGGCYVMANNNEHQKKLAGTQVKASTAVAEASVKVTDDTTELCLGVGPGAPSVEYKYGDIAKRDRF